jgi:hypothetical protein
VQAQAARPDFVTSGRYNCTMPETCIALRPALTPSSRAAWLPRVPTSPDAAVIRLVTVPELAPPYDGTNHAALGGTALGGTALGGTAPTTRSVIQVGTDASRVGGSLATGRLPAGHWPSQFAQVLVETLAGSRPPSQLAPWTTEQARRRISQLSRVLATPHRPRVRRVIVTSPASGVLEMTVIVVFGNRVRALAVRLERAHQSQPEAAEAAETAEAASTSGNGTSPDPGQPLSLRRWSPALPPASQAGRAQPQADQPDLAAGWCCTAIEAA